MSETLYSNLVSLDQLDILLVSHIGTIRINSPCFTPSLKSSCVFTGPPGYLPFCWMARHSERCEGMIIPSLPSLQHATDVPSKEAGSIFSLILTSSMVLLALSLFPSACQGTVLIFLSTIALVNLLGPIMLHFAWRWKTQRGGGWDVAVVKLNRKNDRLNTGVK